MSFADHDFPLTFRVYRDEAACPVPVVRTQGGRAVRFQDARTGNDAVGDQAVVEPFERAEGLVSGRTFYRTDRVPSRMLAEEPVLLTLRAGADLDNGGLYRVMAAPTAFEGAGPNPYPAARIVHSEAFDGDRLFVPGTSWQATAAGPPTPVRLPAQSLGRGVFQLPRGLPLIDDIEVGGSSWGGLHHYDPYHGTIYLQQDGSRTTVAADETVTVLVFPKRNWLHELPAVRGPVTVAVGDRRVSFLTGDERPRLTHHPAAAARKWGTAAAPGGVIGHLYPDPDAGGADIRRVPAPVLDGDRYSRIDTGFLDGSPVQVDRLWIVETDAPADRVEAAIRRSMPAGTLYRTVPAS